LEANNIEEINRKPDTDNTTNNVVVLPEIQFDESDE
jgi:hypothetical protein